MLARARSDVVECPRAQHARDLIAVEMVGHGEQHGRVKVGMRVRQPVYGFVELGADECRDHDVVFPHDRPV
ncbi:hypothetical protein [Burkholderia ubonensis]|uniref:hypothetical protein n=1 Tax=Burkholderia ubonensis TaxID=101571 RepID=UPI001E52EAC5|nr:hypothetical protein [Burkholderia ubonensis]